MRKKVPSLPCTPPSFKNRSYFHKKALLACRPGGLSCGRRMLPHAVCDVASGLFSFGKSPCKTSLRPKNKRLPKAGVWHTGCEVGHRRTTRGTGTQLRGKCFRDWTGDWEKEGQLLQKRPFPQSALRQNSRPHFDGRSSSGLHAYDDERRHNVFGCRSCSPQASGERITGIPPLLLRMPDPGLHHGASCPCAPAFRVSPVSAQNKKACARQAFDIRTATPATTTQRRGPACRPEKSFFGVGWGPGGRKGQFLQKTPLPSPS